MACEHGIDLGKLLGTSSIPYLAHADPLSLKLIYDTHLFYIAQTTKALDRWKLRRVFVFHEAADIVNTPDAYIRKMFKEARNFGTGFIFCTQTPHLVSSTISANIGTHVILRLENSASVTHFKLALGLNDDQCGFIMNMPPRVALVRRPDIPFPFLVRVPNLSS